MIAGDRRSQLLARRQTEFDQELVRFIDFGVLLDRRTRRYLAEIIRHRVLGAPTPEQPPLLGDAPGADDELDATYTRYFAKAVEGIFADQDFLALCRQGSPLSVQVATETLRWLRTTFRALDQDDAHAEERARLARVASLPLPRFLKSYTSILNDLAVRYASHELDSDFYKAAFQAALKDGTYGPLAPDTQTRVEMLLHDLLANWDALLSAKRLTGQLDALTEAQETFRDRLTHRVTEHRRIHAVFTPFVDYLDRGWDLSRELWLDADLDLLAEYATLLESEDDIRRLAEQLGRMQEAEIQTDEVELARTIVTRRWITDETERAEIVGVRESDDLNNVLTSEVALTGDPMLEDRFLQKLVDKRLLTFAFANRRPVEGLQEITEVESRTRRRAKGPFILCVDTSYSMAGQAETLAKVLAFGILRVAIEEDREAYLINFSVHIKTLDLRDAGRQIDTLAAFLRMSFHGGTDVTLALKEGLRKLDEGRYEDADVLVVSDFVMFRMAQPVLDAVRSHRHNLGTRFHVLTFQDLPSKELRDSFDSVWYADPDRPGVIEELADQVSKIRTAGD